MQTYVFSVVIEPDEEGWRAFYPSWEHIGASTWGQTREDALKNIQEVLEMILDEFEQEGKPMTGDGQPVISEETLVVVNR